MKNSLNRYYPEGFKGYKGANDYKNYERTLIAEKTKSDKVEMLDAIEEMFIRGLIQDGMCLSFHHHLRNGDFVLNKVCELILKYDIKNLTLAPSSIFPSNKIVKDLFPNNHVTKIYTDYISGDVAKAISNGELNGMVIMQTHGGRPRAVESGELKIDVAFIAAPTVDKQGNATGALGKSACGALGYAVADAMYAKTVCLVTDNIVEALDDYQIEAKYVDYIIKVDAIGDAKGIVSGTTKITKDPVGLKIARNTANLLYELGAIKTGFSMQTGAGGTSLAVAKYVKDIMVKNNIRAYFASGGITEYFVDMLKEGYIDNLFDVQCFDLAAVNSYRENHKHIGISGSSYANPYDENVVDLLTFAILGATEIDLDFNVNVTTSSHGDIIGGSGGHADVAHGANITVIVTNLIKSRLPIVKEKVTTITTPGEDVDVLVTERGIAINPKRKDLLEKVKDSKLNIVTIEELLETAHKITGVPAQKEQSNQVVGVVEYRDGTIIDSIYKI